MTCNEIEELLPAYREDLLSPEERSVVSGHLASCPRCGRALADLMKTEALVRGLSEVEPPPFFEQRIMSRIRQEAERKRGILRRLFYPLHVKIPIQALATLLIAVLAFHVYQGGDPEMKQIAPLPAPLTDPVKSRVAVETPGTPPPPSVGTEIKRAPAEDAPEKERQRFVAPPPITPPVMTATEKESPPAGSEGLSRMADRAEKKEADRAFETLPQERKQKAEMRDTGAGVGESAKAPSAPSPARMAAAAPISRRPVIDLTIRVRNTGEAIREIEARLGRVNARIVERQDRKGSEFLRAEVAVQRLAALLELLKAIGTVHPETAPPADPEGDVIVSIKIVAQP